MAWIINKIEKNNADMQPSPMLAKDDDMYRVMDWMMKHPGQASSIYEARAKLQAEEAAVREAKEARLEKQRQKAEEIAEREAYANKHLNKSILVTIDGKRAKPADLKDLRCGKCGEPSSGAQDLVLYTIHQHRAGNHYVETGAVELLPNPITWDRIQCPKCKTYQVVVVQAVF